MRAFLLACLAIVIIGAGGYFFVNSMQEPSGVAYTTTGARINTSWAWRSTGIKEPVTASEECDMRKPWGWIFVDFGKPRRESAVCRISQ
jgi:hypothetical protein